MAYIGRQPEIGNFQMCDAISVVNNQASYTMQVAGINVIPGTDFNVICSLNGVVQKAGTSFVISSSQIVFSQNLVTGDVIDFILILGSVLDLGVPSDGTVTSSKLATNISIAGTLDVDEILTTSNANLKLAPNGSGLVEVKGDGSNIAGKIQLNCQNNSHGVSIQSYTLTLPSTAPQNNKVLGVDSSGQLSFTDASIPAPTVTSVSPTAIPDNANTSMTITGTGFTASPQVQFINSSGVISNATTVSFTNSTTIVATSGNLADAAYFIRVENTNGTAGQSGSAILNASGVVTWSTNAGSLGAIAKGGNTSFAVSASSDSAVAYSILSGALPSGYSLNTTTGAITGTENSSITSGTTYNFTIRATDQETQTADRAFSISVVVTASVEYLVVGAGGGGGAGSVGNGGSPTGGGGGGGGIITGTLTMTPSISSAVTVGAGGSSGGSNGGSGGAGGLSKFVYSGNSTTYQAGGAGTTGRSGGTSGSPQSRSGGGNSSTYGGGGGGGAGGNGGTATGSHGYGTAAGGAGLYYANFQQFGYNGYFGAGGSGAYNPANSTGGAAADNNAAYFGGGGGAGTGGGTAGTGASGAVIFRYAGSPAFTGGTISQTGGYTYHVFSSSGTFT